MSPECWSCGGCAQSSKIVWSHAFNHNRRLVFPPCMVFVGERGGQRWEENWIAAGNLTFVVSFD